MKKRGYYQSPLTRLLPSDINPELRANLWSLRNEKSFTSWGIDIFFLARASFTILKSNNVFHDHRFLCNKTKITNWIKWLHSLSGFAGATHFFFSKKLRILSRWSNCVILSDRRRKGKESGLQTSGCSYYCQLQLLLRNTGETSRPSATSLSTLL